MASDGDDDDFYLREAKRLLEMETPELRRLAAEHLEKGAEVLRLHRGWSRQEMAERLRLPPDMTASLTQVDSGELGERIIELRKIAGLYPGELAAEAQVPIEVLRLLEEGHVDADPTIVHLRQLAESLGTNLPFLWYWAELIARGGYRE
jgi:hypothetical protein